ncbi:MAG: Stp1/IreP family PP2C-type Ser/Thr phosphatase, partial [Myxococcota bacterium]|nr:Stp1/IreP family PP2C-type Ser/Thr phosphatase [Myxococcota bacterium]
MYILTSSGSSDVGRRRTVNEDSLCAEDQAGLYVVCDGMGGHASGEIASELTVTHVRAFVKDHRDCSADELPYEVHSGMSWPEALLSNAIQHANDRVFIESLKDSRLDGMGTTLVALLFMHDDAVIAHVGDSRVYRWGQDRQLEQLTRDHSLLNQKIDTGEIRTLSEVSDFGMDNVIVRAIGLKEFVEPEVHTVRGFPGDIFLLCTDGLTDMVDDFSIRAVFEAHEDDLDAIVERLVNMANERGGRDNITALLVRLDTPEEPEVVADDVSGDTHSDTTLPGGLPQPESSDTTPESDTINPNDTQPALPLLMVVDDGLDAEPDVVDDPDEESEVLEDTLEDFVPDAQKLKLDSERSPGLGVTLQI